jgi:hypothetical protein
MSNPKMKTMKTFALSIAAILFSLLLSAQTVSLGNSVWWDMNDNGKKDSGEPVAGGFQVNLYQDNNEDGIADAGFTTLTTITNGSGLYSFSNLAPGKYFVMLNAGLGHNKSTIYGGDPDNNIDTDNNGYIQTGVNIFSQTITLAPGTEADGTGATNTNINNTCDFGMFKSNGLGDVVWLDNNGNGKQESGEPGLANVTVKLKNSAGVILETTTTDANGMYSFFNPATYGTNNYQVEFVAPTGYIPCPANAGSDDAMDSDAVNGIIASVNVPNGTWDHTLDAGFMPITILPVKLVSFTAMLNNNKVDLKWATAGEVNASHFVLEKSFDGTNYTDVATAFAYGNTTGNASYSLSDNVSTDKAGVIYYRLRSVDIDGKSDLSSVRIIRISKQAEQSISIVTYPNPVSNEVRITIPANWQNKKVLYEIFNAAGRMTKKVETASSSQTETINVSSLSAGFYIVRVSFEGQTAQQKIIKQ